MFGPAPQGPPAPELVPLDSARLASFRTDPAACRAALTAAGFEAEPLPALAAPRGCGYSDGVRLGLGHSEPVAASCAAAAAMAVWQRDVVAPAAQAHLGRAVTGIDLAGPAYSCRPIAGRSDGRMSEHARANALDIAAFVLADGQRLSVEAGWRGKPGERAFLRAVRDGACRHFAAVLSPDYNRAHRDHLHFDLGRDRLCR